MDTITQLQKASLLAIFFINSMACADAPKPEADLNASAGYRYDSNVNIAELDQSSGEADNAVLLEVGVNGRFPLSEKFSLNAGYKFTSTRYAVFSEYDLAMHNLQAELVYRIGRGQAGLAANRFAVQLAGDGFVDVTQLSPNVSRLFANRYYLRAAYTRAEKSYADLATRDAVNDSFRGDAYFLLDGMDRHIAINIQGESEDAVDPSLDYSGVRGGIAFGHRFDDLQLKTWLQYGQRHYAVAAEGNDAPREDTRVRGGVTASYTLLNHLQLIGELEYANTDSNVPEARLEEIVATLNLAVSF
jgi:hypothetical protein